VIKFIKRNHWERIGTTSDYAMGLTEKEITVLQLRSNGLTQVEVAKRLKISQAAVSDFEKNAYRKLAEAQEMVEFAKSANIKLPASPYKGVRR
jgi:transcriptional regulator